MFGYSGDTLVWQGSMHKTNRYTTSVLVAAALSICSCSARRTQSARVADMKKMIASEIPRGSSESQVADFLQRHKIEHSQFMPATGTIYAIIRDRSTSSDVVRGAIQMEFHFDVSSKLHDYTVKEVFTGP